MPPDIETAPWAGGLERLGKEGLLRVFAIADTHGVDAAMREAFSRDVDLIHLFRITGRADWRFLLPAHGRKRAVVLGSGLGGTAFDVREDYAEVVSCERSADALLWQNRVAAQGRVVFFDLQLFGLQLFVAGGGVARGRLALLARLRAFDGDDLSRHKSILSPSASLRVM